MRHLSSAEIEAGLDNVRQSPADEGTLDLIVARPAVDERVLLDEGRLDAADGLVGDDWRRRPSRTSAEGGPHPLMQIAIANTRFLSVLAASADEIALAGDQLIVDLDLSEANLPAGTVLHVGEATLEITDEPHRGCAKFSARYGLDALRTVNSETHKALRLRGVYARVTSGGVVRLGDPIRKGR